MTRNIIICSDGTGNTAIKGRGTNVFRIFESVDLHGWRSDPALPQQIVFYDDGVGTQGFKPLRLLGGAFGWGLSRNVKQLYTALARVYDPGDRIYLFGFSRGAFTARTLAGLIAECGVVCRHKCDTKEKLDAAVNRAYELHRELYPKSLTSVLSGRRRKASAPQSASEAGNVTPAHRTQAMADFHATYAVEQKDALAVGNGMAVEFIGVWDTVDAVGLPFKEASEFWNRYIYCFKFPDYKLDARVRRAAHALAIDDERLTFHPLLWNEKDEKTARIQQVWFAGVHSNVGGGYPKQGMSLAALDWMMAQAEDAGLRFLKSDRDYYREHANVNDHLYNSRAGAGMYYRYKPRDIEKLCQQEGVKPKLHVSAVERLAHATEGYSPGNVPFAAEVVLNDPNARPAGKLSHWLKPEGERSAHLLERVKPQIHVRGFAHAALVAVTALAIVLGWPEGTGLDTFSTKLFGLLKPSGMWDFAKKLVMQWYGAPLVAGLAVLVVSRLMQRKMNAVFSRWWHSRRDELQAGLAMSCRQPLISGLPTDVLQQRDGVAAGAPDRTSAESRLDKTKDF